MTKRLTQSEFNKMVRAWAFKTKSQASSILVSQTRGTGNLESSIRFRQRFHKGETERIGFEFAKHGVFVQYGAGRGYVVKNGVIMKGHSASDAQIALLLQRGYALKDAKKMKYTYLDNRIKRHSVDWINKPIQDNIKELADICGEYYGDRTLQHVLQHYDRLMIGGKKKTNITTDVYVK